MEVKVDTQVARLIRAALKMQARLAERIPVEKRQQGEGRLGMVIVKDWIGKDSDGPPGKNYTEMYFKVKNGLLEEVLDPPAGEIRNRIILEGMKGTDYTGVRLLMDCARHKSVLRQAYSEGWFIVTAELRQAIASYDSEEMMQLAEDMLDVVGSFLKRRSKDL